MSKGRGHSRSGAASGHGVRSGVGNLRSDDATDESGEQPEGGQAFAGSGQFTGRTIPPQEPPPPVGVSGSLQQEVPADTPEGAAGASPAGGEVESLRAERDAYRGDLQRLAADFENFRKRSLREKEQAAAAADAKLLGELLAVLDDFERALEHAGAEADAATLADGIRMVHGRLLGLLEQHGLSAIPTEGAFDPHLHEAMMAQPAPEGTEPGAILQTVQKGYQLGERVLRHAKVIVAADD
jgi:molecular chaperone GrpE